jgi:hypothetical protein
MAPPRPITASVILQSAVLGRGLLLAAMSGLAAVHAQDEVPFVTSPQPVTMAMLELAGVRADDVVLDLGSGDGRVVIAAAQHFGAGQAGGVG